MQYRCLVAAALLALAGCAPLDPRTPQIVEVDGIVAEAVQLARAPATEQKAALARAQQAFLAEASAANRLRLAALDLERQCRGFAHGDGFAIESCGESGGEGG